MKKSKVLIVVAIFLLSCNDTSESSKSSGIVKKIHYLLIIDNPDKNIVGEFENFLERDQNSLWKKQPEGIERLSLTVYIPTPTGTNFKISYYKEYDRLERINKTDEFLDSLRSWDGQLKGDRYVLKAMSALLSEVTDSSVDYKILILSDLVENSGGANATQKEEWDNGNFHFIDPEMNCNTDHLNAAITQIDSSTGWIYDNLITIAKDNRFLQRQRVYYCEPGSNIRKVNGGCNDASIRSFWKKLFKNMGVSAKIKPKSIESLHEFLGFEKGYSDFE